jgi:GNAT superfamily N-acetyltransferase
MAVPAQQISSSRVEVRPVRGKKELEVFLHVPWSVGMKEDPNWVPPLLDDYRRQLNPKKSPFLKHGEIECFTAFDAERPVARLSVQIDREFDRVHPEEPGVAFFGFFECVDRPDVARALFAAAEEWARSKGRTRLRGPFTLDTKGEVGVLIDGFDTPPRIGTPHNKPYLGSMAEAAGYAKAKDFYAWWYTAGHVDERTKRIAEKTKAIPGVLIRKMDLKNFRREVDIVREVFNSAWKDNWGFIPFTNEELEIIATEYKMFVDTEIALVAEVDGKPAAICLAIPDVNEMERDFDGELMRRPLHLAKLLWRLKFRRPHHARLMLLGVKEEYRASHKYGTLAAALYVEVAERGYGHGYVGGELSWTLEDNVLINRGIERMGARKYKTYRVYEKHLA